MGCWSTISTPAIFCKLPFISLNRPVSSVPNWRFLNKAGYNIFLMSVDFPDPLTPVTTVMIPNGILTSKFFRLFSCAPVISMWAKAFLLMVGMSIWSAPFKKRRVWLSVSLSANASSRFPWNMSWPPCLPASGPMSMIWSAARMISSSCSTTMTVLPIFFNISSTEISLSVSRGCRPMLGSSKIYMEPTNALPSEVANLMR